MDLLQSFFARGEKISILKHIKLKKQPCGDRRETGITN
jgi:hypothetical protein